MKDIRYKLTLTLIVSTVLLFSLVVFLINYYQQNYILNQAVSAIQNEASYYRDYRQYLDLSVDETRYFDVDFAFIVPKAQFNKLKRDNYFTHDEYYFNQLYYHGDLIADQIVKLSDDGSDYYALLLEVTDPEIVDIYSNDDDDDYQVVDDGSFLVVLYSDISSSTNIINTLNLMFAIVFLLAIAIQGVVGIYLGSRLEDSQRKLKHLFQNASHELKTPLMSIQGYAEGLQTGVIDDSTLALDVIINQSGKMHHLIDEILNISKLDSKGYRLKRDLVDMRDIAEASIENQQAIADRAHIALNLVCAAADTTLIGDSLQLYKAVNTIVDNAAKFATSRVEVTIKRRRQRMIITIYNDGATISASDLAHIFDRFYSGGGISSGIGLAMARQIVQLSKGRLSAQNVADGVVFTIDLPTA